MFSFPFLDRKNFYRYTLYIVCIIIFIPYFFVAIQAITQTDNNIHIIGYLISDEAQLLSLIQNTFLQCFVSSFFSVAIAIPIAWLLYRTNLYGKSILQVATIIAVAIPADMQISTWLGIIGENGFLTPFLKYFWQDFSIYNIKGCIWITSWSFCPLATVICGHLFLSIDAHIELEAQTHLSQYQLFLYAILPLLRKNLFFTWLFLSLIIFSDVSVTDILGIQNTLTQKMFLLFNMYYQPELALFLSIPILLLLMFPMILFIAFNSKIKFVDFSYIKPAHRLGKYRVFATFLVVSVTCIYWLSIPILIYITQSIAKWFTVFHAIKFEMLKSIIISSLSAFGACALGIIFAYYIVRKKHTLFIVVTLLWLAFIPFPLMGISILRFFNTLVTIPFLRNIIVFIQDTPILLGATLALKFLPLATLLMYLAIKNVPQKWEQLAMLEGHSPIQSFLKITFPLVLPSILWAYTATFIFCIGEAIISILMVPPGTTTLSVRILTLLHNGARADVSAACLWLLILILAVTLLTKCILVFVRIEELSK